MKLKILITAGDGIGPEDPRRCLTTDHNEL